MLVVAICGCSSTGKTTVARYLRDIYPEKIDVVHQDDYFLSPSNAPILPNGYVNWDCAEALDLDGLLRDIRKIKQQMTRKFLVVEGHLLFSRQDLIAEFDECILLDLDLQTLLERRQGREFPCSDGTMFTDPPEYVEKVVYPAHVRYNLPNMICQQSFKSSKIDFSQFAEQQYYRKHNNHQMSNKSDNREVSNIIAVLKRDANGRPIHGVYEGTNIRIRLFDDRERVLFFKDNDNPTAGDVFQMIANKLNLANESVPLFSLWIISDELELQIRPRVELFAIVKKWRRWFEKYTHQRNDSAASGKYKFLFKREAMLTIEQERQTKDEVAIKLLYGEARNSVMNGRYPVKLDDAVTLAALQLQISFGDFYVNKHGNGTGFLSQTMDSILPEYIIQKNRLPDLEQKLIMAWNANALKAGVSPYIEYLDFLRKFSFYGATFFTACKNVPPQGYFEKRTDHLLIAITAKGMAIIDEDRHKMGWSGEYEGIEWECSPDSVVIEYTLADQGGKRIGTTLITPQAHLVDSLASRAIYNIERADRRQKRGILGVPQMNRLRGSTHSKLSPTVRSGRRKLGKVNEQAPLSQMFSAAPAALLEVPDESNTRDPVQYINARNSIG